MAKKLKVSTKTVSSRSKEKAISALLEKHPEGLTPKIIACRLGLNHNTVKSRLRIMKNVRKSNDIRGLYFLVEKNTHGVFDWNFHNVVLSYQLKDYNGDRINETIRLGFQNLMFQIGKKSKKATLHISSEPPIQMGSILLCVFILKNLIKLYSVTETENKDVWIRSIEFNKDYSNLRLDGVCCITLDSILAQYKLYQKKEGLREEYKIKVPINLPVIVSLLDNGINHCEIGYMLNQTNQSLNRVDYQIKQLSSLLRELMEIISKNVN